MAYLGLLQELKFLTIFFIFLLLFGSRIANKQRERNENRVSRDHCRVTWVWSLTFSYNRVSRLVKSNSICDYSEITQLWKMTSFAQSPRAIPGLELTHHLRFQNIWVFFHRLFKLWKLWWLSVSSWSARTDRWKKLSRAEMS